VLEQVAQLARDVPVVHVERGAARLPGAEHALEVLGPVVQVEGDVVVAGQPGRRALRYLPWSEPGVGQPRGAPPRALRGAGPARGPPPVHEARRIGAIACDGLAARRDVERHDGSWSGRHGRSVGQAASGVAATGSTGSSGKWQATCWSVVPATGSICGSTLAHSSWARGQRVRKRHPLGGSIGEGSSPPRWRTALTSASGSGSGIAESSAEVYGWAGLA